MPISLLEYCAAGLPVITSNHPPFPETIHPSWGQMVPEQDAGQVKHAILKLLSDNKLRACQGARARTWVLENNAWSEVAKNYRELIN